MFTNIILPLATLIIGATIPLITLYLNRKDMYRTVAIEKRLEAHQKAFEQCMFFVNCLDEHDAEKVRQVFKDAQTFYSKYSLYLEKQTRKKFIEALGFINAYCPRWDYLKDFEGEERQRELMKIRKESKKVFDLAAIIQSEVELEPIVPEIKIYAESNSQ